MRHGSRQAVCRRGLEQHGIIAVGGGFELKVWPDLVRHASLNMSSEDVLGFLGRKLHPSLAAEVVTDTKRRPEGWRVRHRMAGNWVKVYDKASMLRVETVINNPREFRVLRVFTDEAGRRERRCWPPSVSGGDLDVAQRNT